MQQLKKEDIISSKYWHLLTPVVVGDRGLYSLYVGRSDLRVYYLIYAPFIDHRCLQQEVLYNISFVQ